MPQPKVDDEERAEEYGYFLNFESRDGVDLGAIEESAKINTQKGAVMVKNLANNPNTYVLVNKHGVRERCPRIGCVSTI